MKYLLKYFFSLKNFFRILNPPPPPDFVNPTLPDVRGLKSRGVGFGLITASESFISIRLKSLSALVYPKYKFDFKKIQGPPLSDGKKF